MRSGSVPCLSERCKQNWIVLHRLRRHPVGEAFHIQTDLFKEPGTAQILAAQDAAHLGLTRTKVRSNLRLCDLVLSAKPCRFVCARGDVSLVHALSSLLRINAYLKSRYADLPARGLALIRTSLSARSINGETEAGSGEVAVSVRCLEKDSEHGHHTGRQFDQATASSLVDHTGFSSRSDLPAPLAECAK